MSYDVRYVSNVRVMPKIVITPREMFGLIQQKILCYRCVCPKQNNVEVIRYYN